MRVSKSLILSSALALLAIGGCATSTPSGKPASEVPQTGTSGGVSAPAASDSATTRTASASSAGSAEPGTAQTPDERRAGIDRRLNDSLGTFDETLRKEQERIAHERDAREAAAGSAATDESDADHEGKDEPGSADAENPTVASADNKASDKTARPGDLKSDKDRAGGISAARNGSGSGSGANSRDIPDGSDDDIVARRLRKAAEQETDPELKDKLWKEYIEYKKNTSN